MYNCISNYLKCRSSKIKKIIGSNDSPIEVVIKGDSNATPVTVQGVTTGLFSGQPSIRFDTSRGTLSDPALVKNKDSLGVLKFNAFNGDKFVNAGFIGAYIDDRTDLSSKELIDVSLVLGACSSIPTEQFVTIGPTGTLTAPTITSADNTNNLKIKDGKLVFDFNSNPNPKWVGTTDAFLSGTGSGTDYSYDAPITVNTKSTAIKIQHTGNFKQPSIRVDSYDDNHTQASWMAFNKFRGTPEAPAVCQDGDFIFAFDWLGKSSDTQPWEWGMAQTAIVEGTPTEGWFPTSMNWVTRDEPFGPPTVRVKISNNGLLTAYNGIAIEGLEELHPSQIDTSRIKYLKINLNGVECAMVVHPIKK